MDQEFKFKAFVGYRNPGSKKQIQFLVEISNTTLTWQRISEAEHVDLPAVSALQRQRAAEGCI